MKPSSLLAVENGTEIGNRWQRARTVCVPYFVVRLFYLGTNVGGSVGWESMGGEQNEIKKFVVKL
jgi:hypothetical protein